MNLSKLLLISLILISNCIVSEAKNSAGFKNLSVKDGLSQGWVQKIIQDKRGYMWFATNDGLNKYDGNNFTVYQNEPQDTFSLQSSFVSALFEDAEGHIWIGTNHGLNVYDYEKDKITRIDLGGDFFISNIIPYSQNKLIVSSFFGLFIFDKMTHRFERFLLKDQNVETYHNRFRVVVPFESGLLTFNDDGIFYFDLQKKAFSKYLDNNGGFQATNVRSAAIIDSILWIGLMGKGLAYIDQRKPKQIKLHPDFEFEENTTFAITKYDNKILVGTESNGIFYLEKIKEGEIPRITDQVYNNTANPMGLISNSVHSFCIDQQYNLWIGTYNGISYSYGNVLDFRFINRQIGENSLVNNMVSSIAEVDNLLWLGTENGIDIFDKNGIKKNRIDYSAKGGANHLDGKAIITMKVDDDGNVWAGSWSGGISIINPEGKIIKKYGRGDSSQELASESIMNIEKDLHGNMWVGTMGGGVNVFLKDSKTIKKYQLDIDDSTTINNDWIKAILVTSTNEIWISTHTSLELYNPEKDYFHHFRHDKHNSKSIAADGVISMHEDRFGTIWFGTPSGISRFVRSDSTFISYSTSDGLPNNTIQGILSDLDGNIWLSTNSGLSEILFQSIKTDKIECLNYDIRDGVVGNEFIRRSAFMTTDNILCFGSKEGLVMFHPKRITTNQFIPPVIIDKLFVNNKNIKPSDEHKILNENIGNTDEIELSYNQSNLALYFSALNYVVPGRNQYKYIMHGFDDEWKDNGNKNYANYTNIPAGEYTFQVIASNNSGLWNEAGDKLVIRVQSPWYRTKLAYIIYLIFVFMLILYYRHFIFLQTSLEAKLNLEIIEKENLNKVNKLKTRFFTNISHEFLTPLTLILSPLEMIINNQELPIGQSDQLKPVYRNAKRLQRLINQLLDVSKMEADHLALKVSNGDIKDYTHDIYTAFKYLAEQKNIKLEYICEILMRKCLFDGDKIEKILYNLISNALKFTPEGGEIQVSLIQNENQIRLDVKDNGQGIPKSEQGKIFESFYRTKKVTESAIVGTGVGLSLVNGLVKVYGGKITIDSEEGKGTTIAVFLPYKESDFTKENISNSMDQQVSTIDLFDEEIVPINETLHSKIDQENRETILIVEDNIELNNQLVLLLKPYYNVLSAQNGLEGYGKATLAIPALIISDVIMPQMNGVEFLAKIRENESTSHIPMIMLSAKVEMEDRIDSIELGADAYLTKPFEQKHLLATIANLLSSRAKLKNIFKKNITIEPTQIQITSVDEKFITKAIKIVEDNISNPDFTVEKLGQEIGMSRVQLHRKLTALVGMPSSGFIREIKIKRAAELLTKGQLTVSEVMYDINIKSRAYFTKSFKEVYGMLPTEYVKSKKK